MSLVCRHSSSGLWVGNVNLARTRRWGSRFVAGGEVPSRDGFGWEDMDKDENCWRDGIGLTAVEGRKGESVGLIG